MVRRLLSVPALWVWLLSYALYAGYFQAQWAFGVRPIFSITGDEPHYLTIATSLVSDRDLDVLDDYRDKEYFPFYPFHLGDGRDMEDMHAIYGRGGHVYSKHGVGLPLMLAPAMKLGGYGAATLVMIALAATLSAQIWLLARDVLSAGKGGLARLDWAIWLTWVAVALSPPIVLYAPLFYPEVAGAVLTVWAVRGALRFIREGSVRALSALGLACGLLPWLHLRYTPITLVVGLTALFTVLWRWRREGVRAAHLAALAGPPGLLGTALLVLTWRLFGGVPPVDEYGAVSFARLAVGIPGLVFDRQFGLLPYAPAFALVPPGLVALWRRLGAIGALMVLLPLAAYAGFVASFSYWYGAFSPPARMLVPVIPLLAAPLAAALARWPAIPWACAGSLAATAAILKLLVDVPSLRYNQPTGASAALEYLSKQWGRDVTTWLPSFIAADVGSYVWAAAMCAGLTGCYVLLTRVRSRSA
ncbi:MAG: hypothetical protein ACR2NO_04210 [Chloroflexota bacterium]